MNRNKLAWLFVSLFLFLLFPQFSMAGAQAAVTATNEATGLARTTKSNGDGDYVIPLLPPGNYSVSVAVAGFKTQTSTHVAVEVSTTATVNIRLQLGEASQQVTVEAVADILQTDSAANGGVVNDKTVPALPLSSRNYTQIDRKTHV